MRTHTIHRSLGLVSTLLAMLLAPLAPAPAAAQPRKSSPPSAPAPRAFKLAAPRESVLPNGLRLVVVENHAAPVVSLSLSVPAGEIHDPDGKAGLAALTATLLTKGTASRTAEEISATVEDVGGSLAAGAAKEFASVNAHVMADDAPLAFELLADVAVRPAFPAAEVELARSQLLAGLQVQRSQAQSLAGRIFAQTIYGAHPLGRAPTPETAASVTRGDVVRAHAERYRPEGSLLVVAGAITPARATELATRAFAGWKGAIPEARLPLPVPARAGREIVLVNRPGSVQSAIVAGHRLEGLRGRAYFATLLAHLVLGGGNGARLNTALRIQKGWTYGAGTMLSRFANGPGILRASTEVRTEVTDSAVAEIVRQYERLASEPVDTAELAQTKRRLLGSLPLQHEVATDIASSIATFRQLGLPASYLDTLQRAVASLTPADVQRAASSSLGADGLVIVVVGDAAALEPKLRPLGRVKVLQADGTSVTEAGSVPAVMPARSAAIDPAGIVARSDSFALLVQGQTVGGMRQIVERDVQGIRIVEELSLPGQTQRSENRLDAAGRQVTRSGNVTIGGATFETRLRYANGRVSGTTSLPTPQGPHTVKSDTTISPGTLDESVLPALVASFVWRDGATYSLPVFVGAAGRTFTATLAATGREKVTVPAGSFDAWKIVYAGTPQAMTIWVSTAAPHRVVKLAIDAQPVSLELVK